MKLLRTNNTETAKNGQYYYNFQLGPTELIMVSSSLTKIDNKYDLCIGNLYINVIMYRPTLFTL